MFRDIYETVKDYSIIGGIMAIATAIIRPFVSIRETIRNALIVFVFSTLSGLLVEYFSIPNPVKYGISGTFGFFAVSLYWIIDSILKKVEKNPDIIINQIKDKLD